MPHLPVHLSSPGSEASFSSQPIEQGWVATGLELSRMDETLSELCDVFKASPWLSSDDDQGDCGARFYSPGTMTTHLVRQPFNRASLLMFHHQSLPACLSDRLRSARPLLAPIVSVRVFPAPSPARDA